CSVGPLTNFDYW
nr:immunoglobulin heavy chain junction region [Macaca mulatta]MOW19692.1 immunoglobulin heavy chain junction region [Macaca mulatta]MOW21969.1 immunoglobulin heavy chain junction region [Macaca mulatta]